jgi:hypothetical protein
MHISTWHVLLPIAFIFMDEIQPTFVFTLYKMILKNIRILCRCKYNLQNMFGKAPLPGSVHSQRESIHSYSISRKYTYLCVYYRKESCIPCNTNESCRLDTTGAEKVLFSFPLSPQGKGSKREMVHLCTMYVHMHVVCTYIKQREREKFTFPQWSWLGMDLGKEIRHQITYFAFDHFSLRFFSSLYLCIFHPSCFFNSFIWKGSMYVCTLLSMIHEVRYVLHTRIFNSPRVRSKIWKEHYINTK